MHVCASPSSRGSSRFSLQSLKAPILLGLLCFFVFNANLRQIGAGDTLPARYLPLILWHDGTFALDSNARLVEHGHPLKGLKGPAGTEAGADLFQPAAYWLARTHSGQLASLYPVVAPLLAAPLY